MAIQKEKVLIIVFAIICLMIIYISTGGRESYNESVNTLEQKVQEQRYRNELIRQQVRVLKEKQREVNEIDVDKSDELSLHKPLKYRKTLIYSGKIIKEEKMKVNHSSLACNLNTNVIPEPDIQMLKTLNELSFSNTDGGVWKQGFNITYDSNLWNSSRKLKVFIVLHSHNDPGWIYTFDEYYRQQTINIFKNMLKYLSKNSKLKFIWAEIVYFSKWYEGLPESVRQEVQKIVSNGQLEFVTGGWVMPDEAASHWYSVLLSLTEGQTWLKENLNVTNIKSSWAIDPFGHSSSFPFILKQAGFENLLIQRTHYSIKKYLAKRKQLEFRWQQLWDFKGNSEIFTHMMPFYSYDIPHTCGPDPKVCCQFDFRRSFCPWNVNPVEIDDTNILQKSKLLVDQWKKKSQLFRSKSLLTPVGDDFTYQSDWEWKVQTTNFEKLINFINKNVEFNVEVKFATLQEYFDSVKNETIDFPSLSGDFFTYADRDSHYWSGYFTSRPFYKQTDRILLNYLRTAEIFSTLANFRSIQTLNSYLKYARRALSIFQHHDGVSGTARDNVMQDYNNMMIQGIEKSKFVIQQAVYKLMTDAFNYIPDHTIKYFDFDDSHSAGDNNIEERRTIIIDTLEKFIIIQNSQAYDREEIVEFIIDSQHACITDVKGKSVDAQISPMWNFIGNNSFIEFENRKFRLIFKAKVSAFGITVYKVYKCKDCGSVKYAQVKIYSNSNYEISFDYAGRIQVLKPTQFSLKVADSSLNFQGNGLMQSALISGVFTSLNIEFMTYGTNYTKDQWSGAYIFLPDGPAKAINVSSITSPVVVIEGPLESSMTTNLTFINHTIILRSHSKAIEIRNIVDIRNMNNTEIIMRVNTMKIKNYNVFYTDLNGLQYVKRKILGLVPLQGNYYPVNSGIFIEDKKFRLSLFTATPLGGSSLDSGQIEVMQDRRHSHDDNRGLGQGVLDNRPVLNIFKLLIENRSECKQLDEKYQIAFLSREAYREQKGLLHPLHKLIFTRGENWNGVKDTYGAQHENYDDIEIVSMKMLQYNDENALGIVVHRTNFDSCTISNFKSLSIKKLLGLFGNVTIFESTATLLEVKKQIRDEDIHLCPMDVKGFVVKTFEL